MRSERTSVDKRAFVQGKAFSMMSDRLIWSGRPPVAPTTRITNRPLKQAHLDRILAESPRTDFTPVLRPRFDADFAH